MGSKAGQGRRAARRKDEGPKRFFVTGDGVEVKIRPVSDVLTTRIRLGYAREWRDRGEPIDTPTRIAKTVAGEEIELAISADSLEVPDDPEATAERKAKWAAHLDARERLETVTNGEVMSCLFSRGIVVEERDGWEAEQARWHIEIPEDPIDRKVHYILTEILQTPQDVATAAMAIVRLSKAGSVSTEVLDAAEETFRRSLQEGTEVAGAEGSADTGGPLDVQPKAVGSAS